MSSQPFTQEDFAKWNTSTSVFHVPKRLVGTSFVTQLRTDFANAIGTAKVQAVQLLPNHKVRVQFKSSSVRHHYDINGLSFRGVTLTSFPAYEEVKQAFIDRAPLQMADNYLYDALAPFGRVISVKHLTMRRFPSIKTGTRMVSMSILRPISGELKVAGFTLSIRYQGQPPTCYACRQIGHTANDCPRSRRHERSSSSPGQSNLRSQQPNGSPVLQTSPPSSSAVAVPPSRAPADLREKLSRSRVVSAPLPPTEEVRAHFDASPVDLRDKLKARRQRSSSSVPTSASFDMNLSVRLSQPSASGSSSELLAAFDRQVTAQPAVPSQGTQPESTGAVVRSLGKSSHGASGSEDSDDSLAEVAVARKPRSKRFRRFLASQSSSSEVAVWPIDATAVDIHAPSVGSNQHSRSSIASPPVVDSAEAPAEDCLDGSSVVDPLAGLDPPPSLDDDRDFDLPEATSTPVSNQERDRFFASIPELIDLSLPTYLCGDFNAVLDATLDRKRRSSFSDSQSARYQDSGPALQSLLSATQTYPLWRTLHPGRTAYSWMHASGEFASRVDMVWAPIPLQVISLSVNTTPRFLVIILICWSNLILVVNVFGALARGSSTSLFLRIPSIVGLSSRFGPFGKVK